MLIDEEDGTPTQRRAYVLADNKLALNAGWDLEMLSLEIGELGEAGFDHDRADWREAWALFPGSVAYIWHAGTKAGIVQMARGLAVELGPHGVRVNALAPGIVATPLTRPITSNATWNAAYAKRCALGRWAEPEEMAGPIIFLASDASSYLTATTVFADAGWTAIDGRFEPQLKS